MTFSFPLYLDIYVIWIKIVLLSIRFKNKYEKCACWCHRVRKKLNKNHHDFTNVSLQSVQKALIFFQFFSWNLWIMWQTAAVAISFIVSLKRIKLLRWLKCQVDLLKNKQAQFTKKEKKCPGNEPVQPTKGLQPVASTHIALDRWTKAAVNSILSYIGRHSCKSQQATLRHQKPSKSIHSLITATSSHKQSPHMSKYGLSHFPVLSPLSCLLACNPSSPLQSVLSSLRLSSG